jgi:hypothetical protein
MRQLSACQECHARPSPELSSSLAHTVPRRLGALLNRPSVPTVSQQKTRPMRVLALAPLADALESRLSRWMPAQVFEAPVRPGSWKRRRGGSPRRLGRRCGTRRGDAVLLGLVQQEWDQSLVDSLGVLEPDVASHLLEPGSDRRVHCHATTHVYLTDDFHFEILDAEGSHGWRSPCPCEPSVGAESNASGSAERDHHRRS